MMRSAYRRRPAFESLEPRVVLDAVPFGTPPPITTSAAGAAAVFSADLDRDGDMDVLSASYADDTIAWFENIDGAGNFGQAQTISTTAEGAQSVSAADVDGDGDDDVLSASAIDNTVAWYENLGGGVFGAQQAISTTALGATYVHPADVDGDGDVDVLSASAGDNTIGWFKNTDGAGTFAARQVISDTAPDAQSVVAADIDRDGDLDAVTASAGDDTVAWYANTDGAGTFGIAQVITSSAGGARSVHAARLDADGDLDVVVAAYDDNTILWYENANGAGDFQLGQAISTTALGAASVVTADLDADGDLDIVSVSMSDGTVGWHENTDGTGTYAFRQTIETGAYGAATVVTSDLDGDGDGDVLAAVKENDRVAWYRNDMIHRSAVFFDPAPLINPDEFGPVSVSVDDLDGDGDLDAVYAFRYFEALGWTENTDGMGTMTFHSIDESNGQPWGTAAGDVDGDGDVDVVATLDNPGSDDHVVWYENVDGFGSFGGAQVITDTADGAVSVELADIDLDGDLDVVYTSGTDGTVAWHENVGQGSFGPERLIADSADGVVSARAADMDGDGDFDLLVASLSDDIVAWYANQDGAGTFGPAQTIDSLADGAASAEAADVDGDGDLDILAAAAYGDLVSWYENLNGAGIFGPRQTIDGSLDGAVSVQAADLDGDGDLDVLAAAFFDRAIYWYENTGIFEPRQKISVVATAPFEIRAADVDGDGDLDVLPANYHSEHLVWYENRGGQFALETTDTALPTIIEGRADDVLRIDMVHRGRAGDHDEELVSLALLLEEDEDDPLTSAEANALIDAVEVYRDDGSGAFEADTDTLVTSVDTLDLTGGLETISFADGDPNVQVPFGSPATFFVVARLTPDATEQPVDQFRITHVTEGPTGSTAEDANADIPITIELPQNVTSMIVGAGLLGDMDRDGDRDLDDVNGFVLGLTDAQAYEDQHGLPSSVHGDIDGDGDHDLDDVDPFVILLTGGQGGQAEPGGGAASRPERTAEAGASDESPSVVRRGQGSVQASPEVSRTARLGRPMAARRSGELVVADNAAERSHEVRRATAVLAGTRFARRQPSTDVQLAAVWRPDEDWLRRGFL